MKKPASKMIGGSMNKKKMFGVKVAGGTPSEALYKIAPITRPIRIKRQDSGK